VGIKFTEYEFPSKVFYYATKNFVFQRIPQIQQLFKDKIEEVNSLFSGNPDLNLFEVLEVKIIPPKIQDLNANSNEDQAMEDNENPTPIEKDPNSNPLGENGNNEEKLDDLEKPTEEVQPEQREERLVSCKELDRLAFVIRAIEFECSVTPMGSLKMALTHELRYNDTFRGLNLEQALDKKSWLHFRQPLTDEKMQMMQRPETVFCSNFLDDILNDLPMNCWSLQSNITNEFVNL
jgi:radial spoke head protein 9